MGKDEKDLAEDGPDVLQLLVVKVFEDERRDGGDDADEEVGAGQGDEGGAGHGEQEAGGVHQGDGGPAVERRGIGLSLALLKI